MSDFDKENEFSDIEPYEIDAELLGESMESGDFSGLNEKTIRAIERIAEAAEKVDEFPVAVQTLLKGYLSYCAEVIINRALCGIDGLKPVQRKIMYSLYKENGKGFRKCQRISADTMKFHPHSPEPIYQALVRMTDKKGIFNIPVIEGQGSFGESYSNQSASHQRYTEAKLHTYAEEYFKNMQGVEYVPNFDNTELEPALLPVTFPSILVNPTQGIAVGLASNIPSFNILDVLKMTIEYMETGELKDIMYPDFKCGGTYVRDDKEILKVMETGRGKIKLRAKVEISGKQIIVKELPHSVYSEDIVKQVTELNLQGVTDIKKLNDRNGLDVTIYCTSADRVQSVLYTLYKETDLEITLNSNITVIIDNKPKVIGVWDVIREWCKNAENVIRKQKEYEIKLLNKKAEPIKAKIKILKDTEVCKKFIEIARAEGKREAKAYLRGVYPDCSSKEIDDMGAITIYQLGSLRDFENDLGRITMEIDSKMEVMENPGKEVLSNLKDCQNRFKFIKRKTDISDIVFNYNDDEDENVVDDSECYVLYSRGFIKKVTLSTYFKEEQYELVLKTRANKELIGLDTDGRVLRVYLEQLPYYSSSDMGTYLPTYWDLEQENELVWLDILDGSTKMLVYGDGKIGFLDTEEWVGNTRRVRVIEKGISEHADILAEVMDVPEVLCIITHEKKFGLVYTQEIARRTRRARTAVFKLDRQDFIKYTASLTAVEALRIVKNQDRYLGKVSLLKEAGDLTDTSVFTRTAL